MKKTKWIEMTKEERIDALQDNVKELRSIFEEFCYDEAKQRQQFKRTLNGLMLQIKVLKEAIKKLQKKEGQ